MQITIKEANKKQKTETNPLSLRHHANKYNIRFFRDVRRHRGRHRLRV